MRVPRIGPSVGFTAAGLAATGLLSLAEPKVVVAAGATQPQTAIARTIADVLRDELDLEGVAVRLAGTEATLTGDVPTLWNKTEAISRTLAFAAVATVASELTVAGAEDDGDLAEEVARAIRGYRYMTIWDYVGGGVRDGVVTLNGSVTPDRDKAGDLFERVAKIRGVQDIKMQIAQQSASRRDTDLRARIAARALRHPALSHYTLVADVPAFRILVDKAVVTLAGTVRSGTESRVLESIARQSFETVNVVNRLQYPR